VRFQWHQTSISQTNAFSQGQLMLIDFKNATHSESGSLKSLYQLKYSFSLKIFLRFTKIADFLVKQKIVFSKKAWLQRNWEIELKKMVVERFIEFMPLPNAFNQKYLSTFFHWSEFAKLAFCLFFLAGFASHGVLCVDPTVWMELDLPTPVSHSSCGMRPRSSGAYPPQKYICKY
jgi:hypothetical protein